MINWQKKRLSDGSDVGTPDNLPLDLQGLADESLADLGWTAEELGYRGFGFLPVVDLPSAKAEKWERAKLQRSAAIDAGCTVPGVGTFDTDADSRANITGAVTGAIVAAGAGEPFAITWKLADNTFVPLDGPGMIGVGVAVLEFVSACHARAQVLALAIEAAVDVAELDGIDVEAGWP